MKSFTTERFRACLLGLPEDVRRQARECYRLFKDDPFHSSLHFKQIHSKDAIYSVRVGRSYRALGVMHGDEVVWFWIGSHEEYNKLVK
jgi:hypothetical protein